MLKQDRRSEPRIGERVPYVVIHGSPGLPLIQLVRRFVAWDIFVMCIFFYIDIYWSQVSRKQWGPYLISILALTHKEQDMVGRLLDKDYPKKQSVVGLTFQMLERVVQLWINLFRTNAPFLYPSGFLTFLKGYRNGTLSLNGLMCCNWNWKVASRSSTGRWTAQPDLETQSRYEISVGISHLVEKDCLSPSIVIQCGPCASQITITKEER